MMIGMRGFSLNESQPRTNRKHLSKQTIIPNNQIPDQLTKEWYHHVMVNMQEGNLIVLFAQHEKYRVQHVQVTRHVAEPGQVQFGHGLCPSIAYVRILKVQEPFTPVEMTQEYAKHDSIDDYHEGVVDTNQVD